MAEYVSSGSAENNGCNTESVCVHTKKIFSSCRDKDCIEDLCFYPTVGAQTLLSTAQSLKGGSAELLYVYLSVEPVTFNRGYYTVDMRFFYRVALQVMSGIPQQREVEGLCIFDKRVILFGSEGSAKLFSSEQSIGSVLGNASLPVAVVEAVDPIVLEAKFAESCYRPILSAEELPEAVRSRFTEELSFEEGRQVLVTLGQFSIVRLERDTQLLIPVYDYCIPENDCACGCSQEPCDLFRNVCFPVNEFFPPNTVEMPCDYAGTRNYCCNR